MHPSTPDGSSPYLLLCPLSLPSDRRQIRQEHNQDRTIRRRGRKDLVPFRVRHDGQCKRERHDEKQQYSQLESWAAVQDVEKNHGQDEQDRGDEADGEFDDQGDAVVGCKVSVWVFC